MLEVVSNDVRSVTGKNLHYIKLRWGKTINENITPKESFVPYKEVPMGESWRVQFASELLECVNGPLMVDGFQAEELNEILTWICTSGPS